MLRQLSNRQPIPHPGRRLPIALVSSALIVTLMACKPASEERPDLASQTSATAFDKSQRRLAQKAFRIGIIGDSITHGVHFRNRYPDTLERILQRRFPGSLVDAYGIKGQTTHRLRRRFRRDILAHKSAYDTVIIQGGTNDLYLGFQVSPIKRNLTHMIEAAKRKGMRVILMTVGPCHNYGGWNPMKEQRKEELNRWIMRYPGVTVVDTQSILAEGDPPVMRKRFFHKDSIHPNGEGLDAIAGKIAQSIATDL